MTLFFLIILGCVGIDLLILVSNPRWYVFIGIPILIKKTSCNIDMVLPARKAALMSGFPTFKFRNDDNSIWFRTRIGYFTGYTIGSLSITKGIIIKQKGELVCCHFLNMSTLFIIIMIAVLPLFLPIDIIGIIFMIIIGAALVIFSVFRNKKFNEMIAAITLK